MRHDETQKNPDLLLATIQQEEARQGRGQLKIFLGMCPGVGKTFAMLEAAQAEKAAGKDVVIGYVETHGRKETDALAEGLPVIPRRTLEYRGLALSEMDLDAVLARKPQLVLVDELAHTNGPGARHPKRFQDVLELLSAGMDVYTTLNIQHIESRAEVVRQITGAEIRETLPDTILDGAEFVLVDLPPEELRQRLTEGKVYVPERVEAAQNSFFRLGNLAALRELALRFAAEHVGQDVLAYRHAHGVGDPWKSGQRLLVGLSPSPSSAALLRWTRRLAGELQAPWLAVYVELPRPLDAADQARLAQHLALARELGAQVVTTTDSDVVHGVLRVAREQNATQIIVGKPAAWSPREFFFHTSLLNRLIQESGQIDVHVIRAEGEAVVSQLRWPWLERADSRAYGIAAAVVASVTLLNTVLGQWLGYQSLALVYLLSVVVLGMFAGRGPTLAAATVTALAWNFFFVPPTFTLRITGATDTMLFFTYFAVALAMGHLAARLRAQQAAERQREERATALYLLTRELSNASDFANLLAVVIREVTKVFGVEAAIALSGETAGASLTTYFASTWQISEKEESVARWSFAHREAAGHGTATLPSSEGLHLPLLAGERAVGVLSLRLGHGRPLEPARRDLVEAYVRHIALVLDRQRLRDTEQQGKLLAESERLSQTLLNSISHEIRTPLAAIVSAASGISERDGEPVTPFLRTMVGEIQEAAARLNRLVGNLLNMTRLEAGHVRARLDWCDLADLVQTTLKQLEKELGPHRVTVQLQPNLPLALADFGLMQQALGNLLLNAAVHTPPGTAIQVAVAADNQTLVLSVADGGPGLPPESLERIFDKFYRAPSAAVGGTGLGLSIVKGFMEAQGGQAQAANRPGGGALFTLRLPWHEPPPAPPEADL